MGRLKQELIDVPFWCERCRELLSNGTIVCPFCDNNATPIDDLTRPPQPATISKPLTKET